uniref:Uncharacterized protein n=1 Tax=Anguilla anguilla TaxID=7936 RepID=A0A0E9W0W1_ANGAN
MTAQHRSHIKREDASWFVLTVNIIVLVWFF